MYVCFCLGVLQLAFKFVPYRHSFIQEIGSGTDAEIAQQMESFVQAFGPILEDIHKFLVSEVFATDSSSCTASRIRRCTLMVESYLAGCFALQVENNLDDPAKV